MNWGIIGFGEISPKFIESLASIEGQKLSAIASKSKYEFLQNDKKYWNIRIYSNYLDVQADPSIDIIYIATTNNLHKQNVLDALRAGKHVLCEKPLGIKKADVEEMVSEAKKQNKFLMEGMWTRFLPAYKCFINLLRTGAIGKVNFARIDFGFFSNWGNERRLKNKSLFGGTLLDNADYNIFLSQDIFLGSPSKISAFARFTETNVEDMCGVMLQYPNGSIAQLFSSFQQKTNQEALIYGEKGFFHLKSFWNGTTVALSNEEGEKSWTFPFEVNGFEYEIEEVVKCINNKQIESNIIPHKLSVEIAGIMDEILERIKV